VVLDLEMPIVREVMTSDPVTIGSHQTVTEAAQLMRDRNIGDVIVTNGSVPLGIITDRDIVVRAVAQGRDVAATEVGEVCTGDVAVVGPDDFTDMAVKLMRSRAVRRLPVVADGEVVGVVCLGDVAVEEEPRSALADISTAAPNH
jgi:signal-transduction protein with cAMP-binding, CBS, and nucleotidyltransferase domain